ncbi:hypothetical protein [Modestobacter sp. SSW1-42]|uniref:AMIN-like domain-containing (lipo)protein n=1 Tax=Modestobacter sp. SSW1-42 TaxID=596372 RepID=UPI003987FD73
MNSRRPLSRLLLVLAAAAVPVFGLVGPATAATPYCGITWGSTPETDAGTSARVAVTGVRAGQHACFDRLVIDLRGRPLGGYDVRYVPVVHRDGSGSPVPVAGGAALQVVVHAPAHDDAGRTTLRVTDERAVVPVAGFRTLRQVAWAGSFEGSTTLAVGTRARLPFRAFTLPGPDGDRLVVDVAHRW